MKPGRRSYTATYLQVGCWWTIALQFYSRTPAGTCTPDGCAKQGPHPRKRRPGTESTSANTTPTQSSESPFSFQFAMAPRSTSRFKPHAAANRLRPRKKRSTHTSSVPSQGMQALRASVTRDARWCARCSM